MSVELFQFHPIGIIFSPHKDTSEAPIQPVFAEGAEGKVVLNEEYVDGLKDLDAFSHIYLFFYFHKSPKVALQVKPYLDDVKRGVFATRAPHRPNKLGMSLVRLLKIEKNILYVKDLDILDGTPLLDIKPYIRRFDSRKDAICGWQEKITDEEAVERGRKSGSQE